MFAAGHEARSHDHCGAEGVLSGAFETLPSGGAPGMKPWPVPNSVNDAPLRGGVRLAVHRIVLIERSGGANAGAGLCKEPRQRGVHPDRCISQHAAGCGFQLPARLPYPLCGAPMGTWKLI